MNPGGTLWIAGTSLSIEDGGYVTYLARRAQKLGIATRNISVGDQTSVIGYMRVLGHGDEIKAGDFVLWEYSLLDALLTRSAFFADDVHSARRQAWQFLLECGASLIVLLAAPRKYTTKRSACEAKIARDAAVLGLPCIDTRDLCSALGIHDAHSHYRDDRHLRHDSPMVGAIVDAVVKQLKASIRPGQPTVNAWARKRIKARWDWLSAATLATSTHIPVQTFRNSLLSVDALVLGPDIAAPMPAADRIVGIGIVSTHDSGALWCGHPGCLPVSTRLPAALPYEFLLRTTGVPCRRRIGSITSASGRTLSMQVWYDYGQEPDCSSGAVAVVGILIERETNRLTRFRTRFYFFRKRLHRYLRRFRTSKLTEGDRR